MNTLMLLGTFVRISQAILRAVLMIACGVALGPDSPEETVIAVPEPAVVTTPTVAPVIAEEALIEIAQPVDPVSPAARPIKCGDLPRAPWNTCVALHDHEI
jgi:hypothetical protein